MQKEQFTQFAIYNRRMNRKVYQTSAQLTQDQLSKDRKAFFDSIEGTLSHILNADLIWLRRFSTFRNLNLALQELHEFPEVTSLRQQLYPTFGELTERRYYLDEIIARFIDATNESDYQTDFQYKTMGGKPVCNKFWVYIAHFFNHQTHHRGQTTTLLTQLGLDVGVTDFMHVIKESSVN